MKHLIEPVDLTPQEVDEILDLAEKIIADFSLAKSPLLPLRGNSPEKCASQDKVFRSLR